MPLSIAPTSLLPLGDQPTRVSVRLSRDLLKSIDPSMDPLMENDSADRVKWKGKAAIEQMARVVSKALFGAEVPRHEMTPLWAKHVKDSGTTGYIKATHYVGVFFEHRVTAENPSPRVIELTADDEVDGTIVFHTVELGEDKSNFANQLLIGSEY